MMFRFAYPVLLCLLGVVGGWAVFRFLKRPPGITHSMTSRLVKLAGSGNRLKGWVPDVIRAVCLILLPLFRFISPF